MQHERAIQILERASKAQADAATEVHWSVAYFEGPL